MDRNLPALVASSFKEEISQFVGEPLGTCAYCHRESACVPYDEVVKKTFKEQYWFDSALDFCPACAFVITHQPLRKGNWIFQKDKAERISHQQVWDYLFTPLNPPYAILLTTSYKKHQIMYGEGNYTSSPIRHVVFNQNDIVYHLENDRKLFEIVHEIYNSLGQTRKAIRNGEYFVGRLNDEEYHHLCELDDFIKPYRGTWLLILATTLVRKEN